jgi:hypothetical protein
MRRVWCNLIMPETAFRDAYRGLTLSDSKSIELRAILNNLRVSKKLLFRFKIAARFYISQIIITSAKVNSLE